MVAIFLSVYRLLIAQSLTCAPDAYIQVSSKEPTYTALKKTCLFVFLLVIVLVLVGGLALMVAKYVLFVDAVCHPFNIANGSNGSNGSHVSSNSNSVGDRSFYVNKKRVETGSYMHVILIIFSVIISFLKIPEYIMLAWGTHKWLSHVPRLDLPHSDPPTATSRGCVVSTVVAVLLLLALGATVFSFAIKMELDEERCEDDNSVRHDLGGVYMAHCVLDLLNALLACVVRVWMINHTYKVKNVWSAAKATDQQYPDASLNDLLRTCIQEYEIEYKKRGEQAKEQMMPFVPWFLVPWLHFLVLTVINPHLLLTPWTYDYNHQRSNVIARSRYLYLGIVLVYLIQIVIQNGCAMRMNQYHKDYHTDMENRVVYKYGHCKTDPGINVLDNSIKVNSSKKKYIFKASQVSMKFKDEYNFNPTFFSFVPNVNVDNPYYLLVLIVGIAVSLSDFLYK